MEEQQTMTTKEVAEALGISVQAVNARARQCLPNHSHQQGSANRYTQEEVTIITEALREHPSNNLKVELSSLPSTELTPVYKMEQILRPAIQQDDRDQLRVIANAGMKALEALCVSLERDNDMLKHQVEYDKVIGCSRWSDIKKLLHIKDSFEIASEKVDLEENVDYYKKCMGYDKWATIMLTDSAVQRIQEFYSKE